MRKRENVRGEEEDGKKSTKEEEVKNERDANSDYFRVSKFGKKV